MQENSAQAAAVTLQLALISPTLPHTSLAAAHMLQNEAQGKFGLIVGACHLKAYPFAFSAGRRRSDRPHESGYTADPHAHNI